MHSSAILVILSAALASAAPSANTKRAQECSGPGQYYVCSFNGFRGTCSVDPCAIKWCPDYQDYSCTPAGTKPKTDEKPPVVIVKPVDETQCNGNGYFQVCANGFRGCCKYDACTLGYCPKPLTTRTDPTVCAPGTGFFQSCGNGFRGCCKADACTLGYCPTDTVMPQPPVNKVPVEKPTVPATTDGTVCASNTGFFQVCSNGFRGCCKYDACTLGYCPN